MDDKRLEEIRERLGRCERHNAVYEPARADIRDLLAEIAALRAKLEACEIAKTFNELFPGDDPATAREIELAGMVGTLRAQLNAANERVRQLEEALEHICDYWNGSETNGAMSDALHIILGEALAALAQPTGGEGD